MKRILSVIVILVLSTCLLAVGCIAEDEEKSSGPYKYRVNPDGTATITYVYSATFASFNDNPTIASSVGGHTVSTLAYNCFNDNKYIKNITIPDSITNFEGNPFISLEGLTTITVSKNHPVLATIDGVLFDKTTKTLIAYPKGKTESSYTIPNGILSIGYAAFSVNSTLKEIVLPDTLVSIGDYAFNFCGITSIELPNSVETIGAGAFRGTRIDKITLPNSLKSLGRSAFIDTNIQEINLPANLERIEGNPFIRASVSITVDRNNTHFKVVDGVLFDYSGETLLCYPCSLKASTYSVPDNCKAIGASAFSYTASSLSEIILPDSITSIGESAFQSSNIVTMSLPESITIIPASAFSWCKSLKSISVSSQLTEIGDEAFSWSGLKEIALPSSLLRIGAEAFKQCGPMQLYVPASVSFIGENAFGSRYSSEIRVIVEEKSYAETYVKQNKLDYSYPESTDWLNN